MRIDPGDPEDFYLVKVPLCGGALVANGKAVVASDQCTATVLNPTLGTQMTWNAERRMLLLQISPSALHRLAEQAPGLSLPKTVVYDTALPVSCGCLQKWTRQLTACVSATEHHSGFGNWTTLQQQLIEEQLILGLLTHHQSNISHLLAARPFRGNSQIRRARIISTPMWASPFRS